jgi:hypothetical protein
VPTTDAERDGMGPVMGAVVGGVDQGIPRDDVFFYRELLKRGRSLVLVEVDRPDRADSVRTLFDQNGAQRPEAARDELRNAA